jgi:hypothetical protein
MTRARTCATPGTLRQPPGRATTTLRQSASGTALRPGLALPAAVFTLAVIVLFIAGSAFAATQEARASVGALAERLALEAAEYGAAAVLRDWDPAWNVATPVGQTLGPAIHVLAGGATSVVRLTRTSATTWWAVSEGSAGATVVRRAARRTVNAVFRLDMPPDAAQAALGVADSARITGYGAVVGTDSVEVPGSCPGLTMAPAAGVAAPDTMRIVAPAGGIIGTPSLLPDSTVPARVASLASTLVADIVLPAGAIMTPAPLVIAGACDTLSASNWGDPAGGPCATHLPVIRALGDLTVRGGTGQGIIIALGDIVFESGAAFAGLVVAHDDFVTGSGGGLVLGAVLAGDARRGPGDHSVVASGGLIRRSSCRLRQARLAAAPPVRIRERWWAEFD